MVDVLHIQNKTKKPLATALSGIGRELRRRDHGSEVTNVQYKLILNCHNEFPCASNRF
jgi:hypothetical protein